MALVRGENPPLPDPLPAGTAAAHLEALHRAEPRAQAEFTAGLPQGELAVIPGTTHYIHTQRPDVVVDAVYRVRDGREGSKDDCGARSAPGATSTSKSGPIPLPGRWQPCRFRFLRRLPRRNTVHDQCRINAPAFGGIIHPICGLVFVVVDRGAESPFARAILLRRGGGRCSGGGIRRAVRDANPTALHPDRGNRYFRELAEGPDMSSPAWSGMDVRDIDRSVAVRIDP